MRDLDKYEKDYSSQPYERFQVAFRKRKIEETLHSHTHRRILEIGCGLEPLFLTWSEFESLTIVEPVSLFVRRAEAELATHPTRDRVKILSATLEGAVPDLSGSEFDIVLVSSLLHEVENPDLFLAQVQMLVGPETVVHVNVPNARSFHRLLAWESGLIASPGDLSASNLKFQQGRVFDLPGLVAQVECAGFSVFESGSYSFKPFAHRQMEDLIQSGILSPEIIDGLYQMEKYAPGCGSEIFVNLRKKP